MCQIYEYSILFYSGDKSQHSKQEFFYNLGGTRHVNGSHN